MALLTVTGNKDNVLNALRNAIEAFDEDNPVVQQKMNESLSPVDEGDRQNSRRQILGYLRDSFADVNQEEDPPGSTWFASRMPLGGAAQSAMNNASQSEVVVAAAGVGAARGALAPAPFQQFSTLDPGWIECLIDSWKTALTGKAPFVQHVNISDFVVAIPAQCKIALVGDWGGHNATAAKVAAVIRAAHPDICVHLGDIYYAGQKNEAQEFLKSWPMADPTTMAIPNGTSFALNGNHEMFSGAHAYFDVVLPAFGQPASYFGLQNDQWQLLGFDTAYQDHRLTPPGDPGKDPRLASQWNWLVDKIKNSGGRATLFLSHHQPVSAFAAEQGAAMNLRADVAKFFAAAGARPYGWFFGHEHKCTIYDDSSPQIGFNARLIGNGCIPHAAPPTDQRPEDGCVPFTLMNTATNDNGDAMSGFALLAFDGPTLTIQYINEDGSTFFTEQWSHSA